MDCDGMENTVSITTTPLVRLDRTEWVIDQQGNKLTEGPEGVKLNAIEVCGFVLVLMRETMADNLGLKWNSTLIVNKETCILWTGGDVDTNFPGTGEL